jgi:hypothetical protein
VDDSLQAELNELGAESLLPLWLEDVVELAHQLVSRGRITINKL